MLVNKETRGVLCDFGQSRAMQDRKSGLTTSTSIRGTMRYFAPECLTDSAMHSRESDMWALGCLLLEVFYLSVAVLQPLTLVHRSSPTILLIQNAKYRPRSFSSFSTMSNQPPLRCTTFLTTCYVQRWSDAGSTTRSFDLPSQNSLQPRGDPTGASWQ